MTVKALFRTVGLAANAFAVVPSAQNTGKNCFSRFAPLHDASRGERLNHGAAGSIGEFGADTRRANAPPIMEGRLSRAAISSCLKASEA